MKRSGLILSESLVGLFILIIGVAFYVISARGLLFSQMRMEEQMNSARIAKEYLCVGSYDSNGGHYSVQKGRGQIKVSHDGKEVLKIQQNNT